MDGLPFPLQIGSPTTRRQPSVDTVPLALRAGSPATERSNRPWDSRPPLMRKDTSGSNRLSQLFPSRPSSISSISPPVTTATSRRTSHPSPLVPTSYSRRTSWNPAPPPPPSFPDTTAYEPFASPSESQATSVSLQNKGGTKSLFDRLASLRATSSRSGNYNRIEDEEADLGGRRLIGVEEGDESNGFLPVSPDALQMGQINHPKKLHNTADAVQQQRELSEAGYEAEYERLERQLGEGMTSITERPFTHNSPPIGPGSYSRQPRGLPNPEGTVAQAQTAQEQAEKTGGIIAAAVPIDISETFGGNFENGSTQLVNNGIQKSYIFPKDQSASHSVIVQKHADLF